MAIILGIAIRAKAISIIPITISTVASAEKIIAIIYIIL